MTNPHEIQRADLAGRTKLTLIGYNLRNKRAYFAYCEHDQNGHPIRPMEYLVDGALSVQPQRQRP